MIHLRAAPTTHFRVWVLPWRQLLPKSLTWASHVDSDSAQLGGPVSDLAWEAAAALPTRPTKDIPGPPMCAKATQEQPLHCQA